MARVVDRGAEGIQIAGVGQLVQIHHADRLLGNALPHETASDEAGAAGDEDGLHGGVVVVVKAGAIDGQKPPPF